MMELLIFILGASLGSFYHVVGCRLPLGMDWIKGRSRCPNCSRELTWRELLPICSYLASRGRCCGCRQRISWMYPFWELLSGWAFLLSYLLLPGPLLLQAWVFTSLLLVISVTDLYYGLIPNKVLLFFLYFLVLFPFSFWGGALGFLLLLISGRIGSLLLGKTALGGGDIKLFGVVGGVLGPSGLLMSLILASGLGLLYASALKKTILPFGPFIAAGAYLAYFLTVLA